MFATKILPFLIVTGMSLFALFSFAHPFYLSVVDFKYNAKEKTIEGSIKIFTNDLEKSLSKTSGWAVDLIHPVDKNKNDKLLNLYLNEHLHLNVNGRPVLITFLGYEIESEACWIYVTSLTDKKPEKIEVEDTILYESLAGQSNIVQFDVNGNKQSGKVSFPDKYLIFKY